MKLEDKRPSVEKGAQLPGKSWVSCASWRQKSISEKLKMTPSNSALQQLCIYFFTPISLSCILFSKLQNFHRCTCCIQFLYLHVSCPFPVAFLCDPNSVAWSNRITRSIKHVRGVRFYVQFEVIYFKFTKNKVQSDQYISLTLPKHLELFPVPVFSHT